MVRNADLLKALQPGPSKKALFLQSLQQWGFPWTCTWAKWRTWLSKGCRIRLSVWTELELAWGLFLDCSCILAYWKTQTLHISYSITPLKVNTIPWDRSSPFTLIQLLLTIYKALCSQVGRIQSFQLRTRCIFDLRWSIFSAFLQRVFMVTYGMWINY